MRDGLKEIVDRELSGLRWQPRNRNAVLARTKGEPKMKKRLSAGLILAVVLTLAAVSALAVYALTRSPEAEAIYQARQAVMDALYRQAALLGGQVSGEHGIGHAKAGYLRESAGNTAIELMRGIKAVFDPRGILNPGKVIG